MSKLMILLMILAVPVLWFWVGCNSSTGPDGQLPEFSFLPAAFSLTVEGGSVTVFEVTAANAPDFSAQWQLDGKVVSQSSSFSYLADTAGDHVVRVDIVYGAGEQSHQWTVTVLGGVDSAPPPVGNVQIDDGPQAGSIRVSWTAVAGSTYPVTSYVIGCSFQGNLDVDNWAAADVLVTVPANDGIGYVKDLTQDDGMIPGRRVWLGVRAIDERDQMSPLPMSSTFMISYAWYLSGQVLDDHGIPLASVILRFDSHSGSSSISSAADGSFTQGPFSSTDSVRVRAVAIDPDYYTFTSPYLHARQEAEPLNITMLYKYGADASCNANGGDFLSYLRYMTGTDLLDGPSILHKWRSYPVRVFIPDFVRDDGVDFGGVCLQALEFWNTTVGYELLVPVAAQADADVIVDFVPEGLPNANGQVVLVAPQGALGQVTPELMRVDIDGNITGTGSVETGPAVKGVCLHEFGHVLGLYKHSSCDGYRLMNTAGGVSAFQSGNPQPIAADELNAVRSLRFLDDGVDLAGYEPDIIGGSGR